ncbi:hypothetical protein [Kribbella monticola]|uniref:hypothetical protein n=1 Tax=Kribbella monticola TaxID=2185285 RepID=UPI0018E511B3|nr:hypothetical protein [Kribbella monticola]
MDSISACVAIVCGEERLRLPRPSFAAVEARGGLGRDEYWMLGLDEWRMRVGVSWTGDEDALVGAVEVHTGAPAAGTTATYVKATLLEIAPALSTLTGEPHPLANR